MLIVAAALSLTGCATSETGVENAINQIFSANDADHDGCLSRLEWARMAAMARESQASEGADNLNQVEQSYLDSFSELDGNRDQCLTEEEYRASAARAFR